MKKVRTLTNSSAATVTDITSTYGVITSPTYGGYNTTDWVITTSPTATYPMLAVDWLATQVPLLTDEELIGLKNRLIEEASKRNISLFDKVTLDI